MALQRYNRERWTTALKNLGCKPAKGIPKRESGEFWRWPWPHAYPFFVKSENRSGKRQCVVIMRERNGRSLPFVVRSEDEGAALVRGSVGTLATIYADEGSAWDTLHAGWAARRVNHSVAFMDEGVCTNQAESYFSRLRRAEIGTHHHIAGPYLNAYASEMSWREDNRRVSNGDQAVMVTEAAMKAGVSRQWKGYWQRAA